MKNNYYCENCLDDELTKCFEDSFGSVFCSRECFEASQEYRDVDIKTLELTEIKQGKN